MPKLHYLHPMGHGRMSLKFKTSRRLHGDAASALVHQFQRWLPNRNPWNVTQAAYAFLYNCRQALRYQQTIGRRYGWTIATKYSRRQGFYTTKSLSYDAVKAVVDEALDRGLVTGATGFYTDTNSRRSYFQLLPEIGAQIGEGEVDLSTNGQLLVLKDQDKVSVLFDLTSNTFVMEQQLAKINAVNRCFNVQVCLPYSLTLSQGVGGRDSPVTGSIRYGLSTDQQLEASLLDFLLYNHIEPEHRDDGVWLDVNRIIAYHRVFSRLSWHKNGRFHCDLQSLPSALRRNLVVDAHPTCEWDYSGMHINMLYALKGLTFDGDDVYEVDLEWPDQHLLRKALKQTMLRMINAATEGEVIGSIHKAVRDEGLYMEPGYKPRQLVEALKRRHPKLEDQFCKDRGIDLMFLESKISARIMERFAEAGKFLLNIHDGNVCKASDAGMLHEAMDESYRAFLGRAPIIKPVS